MSAPRPPARAAARYDLAALRPPAPGSGTDAPEPAAWQALQHWCQAGSGPGGSPLWAPHALPAVDRRLAVAQLLGDDPETASRLAAQLMLERDGSLQLQACRTGLGKLGLRLKTRLHDLMWWRQRRAGDAWDSGYLVGTPAGLQALCRFMPRRASLLVAQDLAPAHLAAALHDLQSRQAGFTCPVRLLVVGSMPSMAAGEAAPLTRLHLGPSTSA